MGSRRRRRWGAPAASSWHALFAVPRAGVELQAAGTPDRLATPTADALEPRMLRATFQDLLGHPPTRAERKAWLGSVFPTLLDATLGSEEFWRNWLDEQLYFFLLVDNFRPSTESILALPADLSGGKLGVREALHRIGLSSSFDRRNPGPDTYVTVVMEQLLGAEIQRSQRELEIGKRMYDGSTASFLGRTGNSQADVLRIVIEDRRTLQHFLRREHARLLREEAPAQALQDWTSRLERDPMAYPGLVREWLLSEAYSRRLSKRLPQPNRLFVRSLFVDLLDRLPDDEEASRMRNALDGLSDARPLRSLL